MSPRTKAYLSLSLVALIWGVAGPVIKFTLGFFDPVTFLTYRFALIALILPPLLIFLQPRALRTFGHISLVDWTRLVLVGLIGSAGQLGFLFWGFSLTTSIDGTLIVATSPVLVTLACAYFLKDHITRREKIGLGVSFVGSAVIVLEPFLATGRLLTGSVAGNLLIVAGNLCWTAYIILSKKLLRANFSPLFITTVMFLSGLVFMSVLSLVKSSPSALAQTFVSAPPAAHLGVIYMALLSGALAYVLYQTAQKSIETSEAEVFNYLPPIAATPLGYFWLKEAISPFFFVSALLIAAGVIIAEAKFRR